jgi:uncharacterized membrane protein
VVSKNIFLKGFFTTFKPQTTGKYTLTLTNLGRQTVNVDGVLGYILFVNQNNNQVNLNALGGIIAGIILVIIAIITLIVGIIIVIIDRRRGRRGKQPPPIATR